MLVHLLLTLPLAAPLAPPPVFIEGGQAGVDEVDTPWAAPVSEPFSLPFLDGGETRLLVGSADEHLHFLDPGTGRRTEVTRHPGLLARILGPGDRPASTTSVATLLAEIGLQLRRPLMPAAGLWLVEGQDGEGSLAVLQRLQGRVASDRSSPASSLAPEPSRLVELFPNLGFRHQAADDAEPFTEPPNDPRYRAQFFLEDMNMEDAWAIAVGSSDVVISVIDNGCDLTHPDLVAKLLPGHDVLTDDEDPSFAPNNAGNEHGTACAGLIAASTNNDLDVAGVCPNCQLRCTRMLGANSEPVPLDADVRAFNHAFEDDVDVVSNSWGFVDAIPVPAVLRAAIEGVQQNGRGGLGAVVVFASGNDSREIGDDELLAVAGVLGVGAVNNLGELTQFSNSGRSVDVTAPTGTVTTDISGVDGESDGDVTFRFGGTSSAAPLVSGVAALLLAVDPSLTADEVNAALERTAVQSAFARPDGNGHDLEYGFGLVDPVAALTLAAGEPGAGRGVQGGAGCDCGDDGCRCGGSMGC